MADFILGLARRSDLLFAGLMVLQYLCAIAVSLWLSPWAWQAATGKAHRLLTTALVAGGALSLPPIALSLARPGRVLNRYVVAVSQMLMTALFIHLTAGRAESFLHLYVSLAILTFYRNWLVLFVASVVGVLALVMVPAYTPLAQTGGLHDWPWRVLEYSGWLIVEDLFVILGISQVLSEWKIASFSLAELRGAMTRKEVELSDSLEKLREHEIRTQLILERAYEGFVAIDADGRITDWNKHAENMFGWSKQEAVGLKLTETIIPPAFREAHTTGFCRFLETGEGPILNKSIEVPALNRSGQEFPIELSVTPVRVGDSLTVCAFMRDITERKKLIEDLAQARDSAQEASRLKSQFLANMSHEIRTPMNGIIGMSNILLKTKLSANQLNYVHTIRDAGKSLLAVINDILDLSKIEAEKIEFELVPFDLTTLVESVAELLGAQASTKGLLLMTFVSPQVPALLQGDPERVRQILINLTSNAIKFSDEGTVVIRATLEPTVDQTVPVRIAVTDTGVGISEEERRSLFQPFVQADGTISRKYGGTGLGLSISKKLVELMGGEIGVHSTKGQGSTFWFQVPFARVSSQVRASQDLKNVRVLVLDDEPRAGEMLISYLESWGVRSQRADSQEAARESLRQALDAGDPFQVAILHVLSGDALQIGQKIKQDDTTGSTKLILVHDPEEAGAASEALAAGFEATLKRPVRQSHLLDALVQIMSSPVIREKKLAKPTLEVPAITVEPTRKRKELILIADDNPINQQVTELYLAELGFPAHSVSNGKEAIAALASGSYALVLMDCQMPEMDGLEAARCIRQSEAESGNHIPIVAMTAHAMKGDRDECLAAGMDDYLSKPLNPGDLEKLLDRWFPPKEASVAVTSIDARGSKPVPDEDAQSSVAKLRQRFGRDRTNSLLKTFLSDAFSTLARLQDAVTARNGHEVAKAAHYMKGSCGMLQATHLQFLCQHLEEAGKGEDWLQVQSTYEALVRAVETLQHYVNEIAASDAETPSSHTEPFPS